MKKIIEIMIEALAIIIFPVIFILMIIAGFNSSDPPQKE